MGNQVSNGRRSTADGSTAASLWGAIARLAGTAATVPIVAGYVGLGAALVATRGLRNITSDSWDRLCGLLGQSAPTGRPPA
jgi:hypothetical protein